MHVMQCQLCGQRMVTPAILDHVRLMHPDQDAVPERWPDGGLVIYEEILLE
jgi:hypothetical protein